METKEQPSRAKLLLIFLLGTLHAFFMAVAMRVIARSQPSRNMGSHAGLMYTGEREEGRTQFME